MFGLFAVQSDMGFSQVADQEECPAPYKERVFEALPSRIRDLRHQWLGKRNAGCFATHQIHEACDFGCTACYLGKGANATPPVPFAEVKRQLDEIRQHAGPGANTQITSGEVTLLPERELIRIVRYATRIGLDPMLMTHGQRLLERPSYLWNLMLEGGLQKVAVHVDSTQRGRPGVPTVPTESDLMAVRDRFADLIRTARRVTGLPFHAAHTVTVSAANLGEVPAIVRWWTGHADAFRTLSFQPVADVGRTRGGSGVVRQRMWDTVCEGLEHVANPHTFMFGHPQCNDVSLFFVVRFGDEQHIVDVSRVGDAGDQAFMDRLTGSTFMGLTTDGLTPRRAALRALHTLSRDSGLAVSIARQCLRRAWSERHWGTRLARTILRGDRWSVVPASIVVHHFMDRDDLRTPMGQQRLQACAFKVPVDGRMVSMCELNGSGLRDDLNVRTQSLIKRYSPHLRE